MDRESKTRLGNRLRLISFDGGGIRSLSQPRIMETLMHRLEYRTTPENSGQEILPCKCFEMMGGSDTGGLVTLMFGKLRMSVKDVIKEFRKICSEVYMGDLSPAIRTQKLKWCIEDLLRRKGLPVDLKLGMDNRVAEQGCPCFVIATPKENMNGKIKLRTYRSRTEPSLDITLVDAVLATCATQPTFLPLSVGPELIERELVGGGMGMANPCRELIVEAQEQFKGKAQISTIISLGSGHLGTLSSPAKGGKDEWVDVLRNMVESCERTAQEMETQIGHFDVYFRFSVEQGLQRLYGAKVEDVPWLNTQTVTYLQDAEVSRRLDVCIDRIISRQDVITLEQLGLSSAPRADLQAIQSVTQNMLVSAQDEKLLEELRPKDVKGGPPVEECLDGTREDILQKIIDWIDDFDAPNILWLKAYPGAGKTAIALTIVKRLRQLGRLGSSFFFQRAKAAELNPQALWCKIAFNFACKDPTIKANIITKLKADREIANNSNLDDLFHQIIEGPFLAAAENASAGEPSVIVVDALDECGGIDGPYSKDRKELLRTLEKWAKFSRRSKLIATSRDEYDIERILQTISHIVEIPTSSDSRDGSWHDIKQYLTLRFEEIAKPYPSLKSDWPESDVIEQLADQAGGLFIWARTLVDFIGRGPAEQRLSRILKQTSGMNNMGTLYSQILNISFPEEIGDITEAFRSTLGTVILAKTPLSVMSLSNLLSIEQSLVEHICTKLKSVIRVEDTIQVMHQSFVDFLLDPKACPSEFCLRIKDEEQKLALACLRAMRCNLRFNICNLESSYLLNSEIHDLESRINQSIPTHVLYSCRHSVEHVVSSRFDTRVLEHLQYFTENQFLFWLEVMSVTNQMSTASNLLSLLMTWMKKHGQDELMVGEMNTFVRTFASVMAQSAPHIYLSALPFSPRHSIVSKYYTERYPGSIRVEGGGLEEWPGFECVMYGHGDMVLSVAFSPDGTCIASGSWDKTVRLWNAATGQPLRAPFEGHTLHVTSVAFSPDGTRIVSGSYDKTVRVWDAATGQPLGAPFEGHNSGVVSVAFSPDGTRIASGSYDKTVRIWDAATGQSLGGPLIGHTGRITSVAFSPDGTRITSGSWDKTVRLWHAVTGQSLPPFEGHTDWVTSVAFSSDSTRIVSGSCDKTVRAWDAATGQPLGTPFEGHNSGVVSVSFSSDGTRILSGSDDKTVRVWDAATSQPLGAPFKGHTGRLTSIAFSSDSTRIVSGSDDNSVQVWDVVTGQPLVAPFRGHIRVTSVAFSPDGTRIVSGAHDSGMQIWDVATGQPLRAPLKGHTNLITSVAFSPDGTRIVSSSYDKTVRIWDAATGQSLGGPLIGHTDRVTSVAFSPDGTRITSGSWDKTVRLWHAVTGQSLPPFEGHTDCVTSVAFSPDGARIVSGSSDTTVRVWDATTGRPLGVPFKGYTGPVTSVAFSSDGIHIVSGSYNSTVHVWDAVTGQAFKAPFKSQTGSIIVALSSDGTHIVSGSRDNTVRVWDAETVRPLGAPFQGHTDWVKSVAFSPDGTQIVSGSNDCTVRVWDAVRHDINKTLLFRGGLEIVDGWVLDSKSERLFWVLPSLQAGLWLPGGGVILGNYITKVNMERFQYGKAWTNCQRTLDNAQLC